MSLSCAGAAAVTIFDKILSKEIPSDKVYEDDVAYAFKVTAHNQLNFPRERTPSRASECFSGY